LTDRHLPDIACPFCAASVNPDARRLCAHVQLVLDENRLLTVSRTTLQRIARLETIDVRDFGGSLLLKHRGRFLWSQDDLDALRTEDPSTWEAARDDVTALETSWDIAVNCLQASVGDHVRMEMLWAGRTVILFFSPETQEIRPIEGPVEAMAA
jgi:hypothetical protein